MGQVEQREVFSNMLGGPAQGGPVGALAALAANFCDLFAALSERRASHVIPYEKGLT